MKNLTQEQIRSLVSYYETSAYAQTNEISDLAEQLMEESENIEEVENEIFTTLCQELADYEYIECENQGDYRRHIWHKM